MLSLERGGRFSSGRAGGLQAPTCLEYLPAVFGIGRAGGVAVPLNHLFGAAPLRHALTDSEAQWVLARAEDVVRLQEMLAGLPVADRVIALTPIPTDATET